MGYHLYHFYEDDEKLAQILAKYFAEGLRKLEYCMWIPREGISHNKAIDLLKRHIPEVEDYLLKDQMYIEPFDSWALTEAGMFDMDRFLKKWMDKYDEAMSKGFIFMRAAGDPSSILSTHWNEFMAAEARANEVINDWNAIIVCTYKGKLYKPSEIQTILRHHFYPLTPVP